VAVAVVDVQVSIGNALNATQRLKSAASELQVQFQKVQTAATSAGASAIQFGRNLEQNTRKLREQASTVQGLVGAYAGFRTIKGAISAAVELESAEKRAELLTQRFTKLSGIQQVAAQSADKFRISQTATLTALVDLGNRLGPQGATINEIKDVYEGFNTILAINKVSTQEAAAAQLQLNQALGSGRLAGDEFRSVNEATPQVIDEIAKIMKIARGEVKDFAAEGKVTAPILIQALRNIKEKGADVLEQSFNTAGGRLRAFQKAQVELAAAIGTQLLPAFTPLLTTVTDLIVKFAAAPTPVKGFTAAVVGITGALVILGPVISGTITLIKAIGVATLVAGGPWIALAAGITAATVALASFQTQSQKRTSAIGAAALTGDTKALKEARTELKNLQTQIDKTKGPSAGGGQRSAGGQTIANLKARATVLQRQIQQGEAVASAAAMPDGLQTLPGGDEEKKKRGKTDAERAAEAAAKERQRVAEVVRDRVAEAGILRINSNLQDKIAAAQAARDPMLVARLQGLQREVDLQYKYAQQLAAEKDLRAQEAIIFEGNTALIANQRETQRSMAEIQRQQDQDHMDALKKHIEQQYELNTAVQQQKALADGIAGSLGQGLTSTFDLLIQGSQNWQQSLQQIASGVLVDIANQLLRIFVIEQAINSIRAFLTPFSPSTPIGAGGGAVGRFGTLGPNYGIPQRANGGSVMAGQGYLVGERGPELFMPGRSGGIAPSGSFSGGANVVVNVDASGTSAQGNGGQANQLGKVIGAAVQAELIKQRRPGGLLA
jgi:tape measure domain-containing protein